MQNPTAKSFVIFLCYLAFVIYGSLIPFELRETELENAWLQFKNIRNLKLGAASRADWVANILLYIPLAYFLSNQLLRHIDIVAIKAIKVIIIFAICGSTAIAIEFAQIFFAPRTVSLNDIEAEFIGISLGVFFWLFGSRKIQLFIIQIRQKSSQTVYAAFILYFGIYLIYSGFPYDFVTSLAEIQSKIAQGSWGFFIAKQGCGQFTRCALSLAAEFITIIPIGMGFGLLFKQDRHPYKRTILYGLMLSAGIEAFQFFIVSGITQGVSIVLRVLGLVAGVWVYYKITLALIINLFRIAALRYLAMFLYFSVLYQIVRSNQGVWLDWRTALGTLKDIHFLPFYYHYFTTETHAVLSFITYFALYFFVGLYIWLKQIHSNSLIYSSSPRSVWIFGGVIAFFVEVCKLFLEKTHPDPTNVLIGLLAPVCAYKIASLLYFSSQSQKPIAHQIPITESKHFKRKKRVSNVWHIATGSSLIIATVYIIFLASDLSGNRESLVDESILPKLPAPEELPAVRLPNFNYSHPRLPAPTSTDIFLLEAKNPEFLKTQARWAERGTGGLTPKILTAFIKPGTVNLDELLNSLINIDYIYRGNGQITTVAQAYDWLYPQWTSEQKAKLLNKLIEGCHFAIKVIRQERLSPYNVYLYNTPFQSLVTCAIASYGDNDQSLPIMNFTDDLWKHRVLPVWAQIMGQNGGWHEGGEYVGIGIGKAVYQIPALWRQATGEDFFKSEPGIRGFLDFLIYRTRPDGTDMRWEDGRFFDNNIADRLPLAIEYNHKAAYSLKGCPKNYMPTSWPWGPLTSEAMCDESTIHKLPLDKHFDGIGMIIARSAWGKDATYVAFKAGDNYWSHTHLDQGAFTIYKGGPLAIDSGLYTAKYESDHHMNYSYQTIAHNVITVTDYADNVPAPAKNNETRPIANDGGQRRIGSGWGVESAPLGLDEWLKKKEIYHTGKIEKYYSDGNFVIAIANVTPAYTNRKSGTGTFSDRTRRVDDYWRTFIYDRKFDVVVVYDNISATNEAYTKRSIFHTINRPYRENNKITVHTIARTKPNQPGGKLEATVLFPKDAFINIIGGKGAEFFVLDKNYDEGGALWNEIKKRKINPPEPGSWRVEIIPPFAQKRDQFLTVYNPKLINETKDFLIQPLETQMQIGCRIKGNKGTHDFLFSTANHDLTIQPNNEAEQKTITLSIPEL